MCDADLCVPNWRWPCVRTLGCKYYRCQSILRILCNYIFICKYKGSQIICVEFEGKKRSSIPKQVSGNSDSREFSSITRHNWEKYIIFGQWILETVYAGYNWNTLPKKKTWKYKFIQRNNYMSSGKNKWLFSDKVTQLYHRALNGVWTTCPDGKVTGEDMNRRLSGTLERQKILWNKLVSMTTNRSLNFTGKILLKTLQENMYENCPNWRILFFTELFARKYSVQLF
jgi:hypothetical protein